MSTEKTRQTVRRMFADPAFVGEMFLDHEHEIYGFGKDIHALRIMARTALESAREAMGMAKLDRQEKPTVEDLLLETEYLGTIIQANTGCILHMYDIVDSLLIRICKLEEAADLSVGAGPPPRPQKGAQPPQGVAG